MAKIWTFSSLLPLYFSQPLGFDQCSSQSQKNMPPYLAKNKNDRMTSNHFWAAYSPVKTNGERFTLTNFKSTYIINDRHRMHIHHK